MTNEPALTALEIVFRLAVVLLLVLANAFFVAAEFALVGARRTRIEALARAGNRRAKLARGAIRHLNDVLSATQLGITLASLGLGWVGEGTLAAMFRQFFDALPAAWAIVASHTLAGVIAFLLITFLHIVIGELAPKGIAVLAPERTSLWTAGPLVAFARVFRPVIWLLNGAANLVLRPLGVRSPSEIERVHRPEEIEMLVTQSYEHGLLNEEPVEMIRGVFDLTLEIHKTFGFGSPVVNLSTRPGVAIGDEGMWEKAIVALTDLDGQGSLALFVGGRVIPGRYPEPATSFLFRSRQGRWELDAENTRQLARLGLVSGAVWSDLDGDGFPELILACEWGPIRVFHNDHGRLSPQDFPLTFTSSTPHAPRSTPHALRPTPHAPRSMLHVPRPKLHAPCPTPHAPRPMLNLSRVYFQSFGKYLHGIFQVLYFKNISYPHFIFPVTFGGVKA